jgi:hypothetical protein
MGSTLGKDLFIIFAVILILFSIFGWPTGRKSVSLHTPQVYCLHFMFYLVLSLN